MKRIKGKNEMQKYQNQALISYVFGSLVIENRKRKKRKNKKKLMITNKL